MLEKLQVVIRYYPHETMPHNIRDIIWHLQWPSHHGGCRIGEVRRSVVQAIKDEGEGRDGLSSCHKLAMEFNALRHVLINWNHGSHLLHTTRGIVRTTRRSMRGSEVRA